MLIALYKRVVVWALKDMTTALVATVESLGIRAVQDPHSVSNARGRGLYADVIVVAHHAVEVADPFESVDNVLQPREKPDYIPVVTEDDFPGVSARRDVVERTIKAGSRSASHGTS
jgi:hypothetical protein